MLRFHSRIHAAAATRPRASVPDDIESFFITDLADGESTCRDVSLYNEPRLEELLTKWLEGIGNINRISFLVAHSGTIDMSNSSLNSTTINNDRRPVVSQGRNQTSGHVFITSWHWNVTIIVLRLSILGSSVDSLGLVQAINTMTTYQEKDCLYIIVRKYQTRTHRFDGVCN